jgi:hypothetical protein
LPLISDTYTSRARVQPVLLAIGPVVAFVAVLTPIIPDSTKTIPLGLGLAAAIAAQLGRDRGQGLEKGLFEGWGGIPTTQLLRFKDARSTSMVHRRHRQLQILVADDFTLPSEADELADPEGSDRIYNDAVAVLRAITRDANTFPLVLEENANYGFRRNMLGLRGIGLRLAWGVAILSAASGVCAYLLGGFGQALLFTVPLVTAIGGLVGFRRVTPSWVKQPASAYARALLETLDLLEHQGQNG